MEVQDNVQNHLDNICGQKSIKISEWNPKKYFTETIKKWKAFTMIISGSSKSGKSMALRYLLSSPKVNLQKEFSLTIVFSKTLVNGFYQEFIDSKLMFQQFDKNILDDIKKIYIKKKAEGKCFRWLIIFDDIANGKSKYEEAITDIFFSGRHYGCSIIYLTQKVSLMSTAWISNTMVFLSYFAGSRNEKTYLADKIVSDAIDDISQVDVKKSHIERKAYLLQSEISQDFRALVILPYETSEKVFWFKSEIMKKKKANNCIYEKFISLPTNHDDDFPNHHDDFLSHHDGLAENK